MMIQGGVALIVIILLGIVLAGCANRPDIREYNGMFRFKTANDTTLLYAEFDGTSVDVD